MKMIHNAESLSECLVLIATQIIEGKSAGKSLATFIVSEVAAGHLKPVKRDTEGKPIVCDESGKVEYGIIKYGADIFDAVMDQFAILEQAKVFDADEKKLELGELRRIVQSASKYAMAELAISEYNEPVAPTRFSLSFDDSPEVWARTIAARLGEAGHDVSKLLTGLSTACAGQAKAAEALKGETVTA